MSLFLIYPERKTIMKTGILIPAYQPDGKMVEFVRECAEAGFEVTVVNDGSSRGLEYFEQVKLIPGVTLIGYEQNRGKGHALKTGIQSMEERGFGGVITADAYGQHLVSDIKKVAAAMEENPGKLVMGARDTDKMPPRSQGGNRLTRRVFRLLYGIDLKDSQTGLRGIPLTDRSREGLLSIRGDRYEYEMEMLTRSSSLFPAGIFEQPISTVYFDGNKGSHFRPVKDSARIFAVILRRFPAFMASSLLAFGIDYSLFNLFFYVLSLGTAGSTVCARLVSASANFLVNKYAVFHAGSDSSYSLARYAALAAFILCANIALMHLLTDILGMPAYLMKILVESLMYILSFVLQNKWSAGKKAAA